MIVLFTVWLIIMDVLAIVAIRKYYIERKRYENYRKEVEQEQHDEELLAEAKRFTLKTVEEARTLTAEQYACLKRNHLL